MPLPASPSHCTEWMVFDWKNTTEAEGMLLGNLKSHTWEETTRFPTFGQPRYSCFGGCTQTELLPKDKQQTFIIPRAVIFSTIPIYKRGKDSRLHREQHMKVRSCVG